MTDTGERALCLVLQTTAGSAPLENERRERFCQEYCLSLNASDAARKAGYSPKTAKQQGSRLLTDVDVAERVDFLKNQLAARLKVRKDRALRELADIAMVNIGDFVVIEDAIITKRFKDGSIEEREGQRLRLRDDLPPELYALIQSITVYEDRISIKMWDKLKAIELMARIKRWVGESGMPAVDAAPGIPTDPEERRKYLENLPSAVKVRPQTKGGDDERS